MLENELSRCLQIQMDSYDSSNHAARQPQAFERPCIESNESPFFGRAPPHDVLGTHQAPGTSVHMIKVSAILYLCTQLLLFFTSILASGRIAPLAPQFLSTCTAVGTSAAYLVRFVIDYHASPITTYYSIPGNNYS